MFGRRQILRVGLPLLGGVALDERLVERTADQRDGLLLEVLRVGGVDLGGLLGDQRPRLVRGEVPAEELRHQAQAHRELVGLPVVHREDPVLVAGEVGELPDVVPHPLVGGVEQVRAVFVHLDTGLRLGLGVGVAADVRAPLDDQDPLAELGGHALGDRQAEESGADDEEVETVGGLGGDPGRSSHRQQGYPTRAPVGPTVAPALASHAGRGPRACRTPDRSRQRCKVAIRSRFDHRHSSHTSHSRTIDHVCQTEQTATRSPDIEETSVPNRRRRKLSTAMSAVAALAVASPFALVAVSELTATHPHPSTTSSCRPRW